MAKPFVITKLRLYRPSNQAEPFIEYIVGTTKIDKHFVERIEQLGMPERDYGEFKITLTDGSYLVAGGMGFVIHCEQI